MTTLKPYPAYRGSGVDWFGEVPEHWDSVKQLQIPDPPPSEQQAIIAHIDRQASRIATVTTRL